MQEKSPKDSQSPQPSKSGITGYLQVAAIIIVIGAALYFARAPKNDTVIELSEFDNQMKTQIVNVLRPEITKQSLRLQLNGSVVIKDRVKIISEIKGPVIYVSPKFDPGGTLEANEVFIKIDPTEYALKVEELALQVAALENVIAQQTAARTDVTATQTALDILRVKLQLAELELSKTEMSLPYSTRVVASNVSVGEIVGPAEIVGGGGVELGRAYRPDFVRLTAEVTTQDLDYFDPIVGRKAKVTSGDDKFFDAQVVAVLPVLDIDTRLSHLFFKFSDNVPIEERPLPRTFVEIEIEGPEFENAFLLPETADQGSGLVWIVKDGALVSLKPQQIGKTDDGWSVEAFDFADGIVLGSFPGMSEGTAVQIADSQGK